MTKKVLFGNNYGYLIDNSIKEKIIDFLYTKIDLSKYRYIILNTFNNLKYLKDEKHYVSPNFKGNNYLLIMVTINNKQICVVIDRKKLSYHRQQLKIKDLEIIKIELNDHDNLFKSSNYSTNNNFVSGSIFTGKLIMLNNNHIFLIQDCFYLSNEDFTKMDMQIKLQHLNSIIKTSYTENTYCINFHFRINQLYTYNNLKSLIQTLQQYSRKTLKEKSSLDSNTPVLINNSKIDNNVLGLMFFPPQSGINIIYLVGENTFDQNPKVIKPKHNFDEIYTKDKKFSLIEASFTQHRKKEESNDQKNLNDFSDYSQKTNFNKNDNILLNSKSYNIIHNYVDFLKSRSYSYEYDSHTKIFWLTRNSVPDVYNISDIALIPTLKISQLCDNLILDKPQRFNCVYSNKFKKWIPVMPIL
jgi:hypothetical protein